MRTLQGANTEFCKGDLRGSEGCWSKRPTFTAGVSMEGCLAGVLARNALPFSQNSDKE
ncbi:MAG: hypothetical protein K6F27_11335 [Ruminococcus sp.]|nr:hypothetical protein [Ruminococcus sp.]